MRKEISERLEMQLKRRKDLSELKIRQTEQELINQIKEKTSYFTIKTLKKIIENRIDNKTKDELVLSSLKEFNNFSKN